MDATADHVITCKECAERRTASRMVNEERWQRLEDQILALKSIVDLNFDWVDRSVKEAYAQMNHRLSGMNEFRDSLRDQSTKFPTREEMMALAAGIQTEVKSMRERETHYFSRPEHDAFLQRVDSDIKAIREQQLLRLTRDEHLAYQKNVDSDIRVLRESKAELAGKASQEAVNDVRSNVTWSLVLGGAGIITSLVSLAVAIMKLKIP